MKKSIVVCAAILCACAAARAAGAAPDPGVGQVIVVFKTHFDIGYTDLAREIVKKYRTTMIDQALAILDRNVGVPPERRFVWTLSGWPLAKIAEDWPGQSPERLAKVRTAIREGWFVVHALPFTTHTELLEPEDLVRGLGFSSRLSRQAGLPLPRDAKMTDVPSHSWILPTLLRAAGVEFLHLGCNAASQSPRVPPLFWWEGPDGSRLLTMYSAAGYGTGLVPPADWPHRTWLALLNSGDNEGPPKPEEVGALLAEAAQKIPGVKVRIGRLSDFADALLAEKPDLPVVRGDMPDTWIEGPMADPLGSKLARNLRPEIGAADSLGALLQAWGVPQAGTAETIARAYEHSLLYGEHTWGGALYWVTPYGAKTDWSYGPKWSAERAAGRFRKLEESWAEHSAYIEKARDILDPLLARELKALAEAAGPSGRRFVVFNPLPWPRDGVVQIAIAGAPPAAVGPAEGGPAVPVESADGVVRFFVRAVPALGYRTYVPAPNTAALSGLSADPVAHSIENRWFKVILDPARGAVRSLVDKRTGRELIDAGAEYGFGQYLYERFDADQVAAFRKAYVKIDADWGVAELGKPNMPRASQVPYAAHTPANGALAIERSAASVAAVLRFPPSAGIRHGVAMKVILGGQAPYVDLEISLLDKPADNWPEAGWIALPFKADSPSFKLGRLGSIVDPAADIVRGANHHLFGIHTGVAVLDSTGRGAGICAPDDPLVSLDQPGLWKYSLDFMPKKPVVYVNLFNNQWTTNFRMWNEGTWTSRVRVWPIDGFEGGRGLIIPSLETRYPLLAAAADGPGGKLPAARRGVEISSPGTLLTAFGPNPDGPGTILRLWELAGRSGRFTVRLPEGMSAAEVRPVDLRGRPAGAPLAVSGGVFVYDARAFAPASFLIPGKVT